MKKLKASELKQVREQMWIEQGGYCAMCKGPLPIDQAVMDHDHKTGLLRGVAHRGCNSLEGKIVNAATRFGVPDLASLLSNLVEYHKLHSTDQTGLIYPSHKTPAEKKVAAAKKRKKKLQEKK